MAETTVNKRSEQIRTALDGLKVLLEKEEAIIGEAVILFDRERKSLADFSLQEINECSKKKETIALKMKMLDEARQGAIDKFARAAGVEPEGLTVTGMGEIAGEPYKGSLEKLAARLRSRIEMARRMQRENEKLVRFSADSIKASIYLLTQAASLAAVYGSDGKVDSNMGGRSMIFSRRS